FTGLEPWASLGAIPVLAAAASWWCARREYRTGVVTIMAVSAVSFVGALVAGGAVTLDNYKSTRALVKAFEAQQTEREIRVGSYQYFQPSLVFYCRREVRRMEDEEQALEFLRYPLPVYLFLPAQAWADLEVKVQEPHRLLSRHQDLYRGCDIVVVTNT